MNIVSSSLDSEWLTHLQSQFTREYMMALSRFLHTEEEDGKILYPAAHDLFAAFNMTPLSKVRVVIIGQDPYHGAGQAHGLSFSVPPEIPIPPSLKNIYKEINRDLGLNAPSHGNLSDWAEQGVLLLNSVLTVEHSKAASHQKRGWEEFTDEVIRLINTKCSGVVFLLWGAYAQKKGGEIDEQKHLILRAPHPSPLSAHRGFFGCGHFSKANRYLESLGSAKINWQVPE